MHVTPALLKCHHYFVTDLMVAANPEYNDKQPVDLKFSDLQIDSTIKQLPKKLDGRLWRVILQIQQNVGPDKNSPYNFSITMLGHYEVSPSLSADRVHAFVTINGSSILYSTARQILKGAMHNGPYPTLELPTVCFHDSEPPSPAKGVAEPAATYGKKNKPQKRSSAKK
jgi:preprotein translocase subunit SecB